MVKRFQMNTKFKQIQWFAHLLMHINIFYIDFRELIIIIIAYISSSLSYFQLLLCLVVRIISKSTSLIISLIHFPPTLQTRYLQYPGVLFSRAKARLINLSTLNIQNTIDIEMWIDSETIQMCVLLFSMIHCKFRWTHSMPDNEKKFIEATKW